MLLYTTLFMSLATWGVCAPSFNKQAPFDGYSDAAILNYALAIERLESEFYKQGLANYTKEDFIDAGFSASLHDNLAQVSEAEAIHVDYLVGALEAAEAKPVAECKYSFPAHDAATFVGLAALLEGIGNTAYLGAAADIKTKTYLTSAGAVMTTDSPRSAGLSSTILEQEYSETPNKALDLKDAHTLAASFFLSCPDDHSKPPIMPFPHLVTGGKQSFIAGQELTLFTPGYLLMPDEEEEMYAAFIGVYGVKVVQTIPIPGGYKTVVPNDTSIHGQTYVVLTTSTKNIGDDNVSAGPVIIRVIAPKMEL